MEKQRTAKIEAAMVYFGDAIKKDAKQRKREDMEHLTLVLAHAIREAVAPAFDVQATELEGLREKKP